MTDSSLGNFDINQPQDRMPDAVVKAFGVLKSAAATVNMNYGLGKKYFADYLQGRKWMLICCRP